MKQSLSGTDRAWIEVNLNNLEHNAAVLKRAMPKGCELMAVVKAQAYGHGASIVAGHLNKIGVRAFAVATIQEGIELRQFGIIGDILILGYTDVSLAPKLKQHDLTQTLIDFSYAIELDRQGVEVKAHLKVDTGMHRLGIDSEDVLGARQAFEMKNIKISGIFTHLCCADSLEPEDVAFTRGQIEKFYRLIHRLRDSGIAVPKLHIQSSYGLLNYPDLSCDYVRAGIALYGVLSSPGDKTVQKLDLRPVLSLKSRVVLIKDVKKGEYFGYGRNFLAERDSRIAILSIGYGDGFPRNLSHSGAAAEILGHSLPIIGNICMDQLAVDITGTKEISPGDTATLIGTGEGESISAPFAAEHSGSISNELLCRMGARLPVVAKIH
ncbi:MAG: serine racemase VanT catalytic subunit [Roseburia sp.]|nr:serine racemase VanT catalytic subunit [Roseburia sp.]